MDIKDFKKRLLDNTEKPTASKTLHNNWFAF